MTFLARTLLAAWLAVSFAASSHAQATQTSASADEAMSSGEVRKIDRSAGKLTIKHGPLRNLGMGGMTMAFRVQDPAMLDAVQVGDRIRFVAEQPNGQLTVTRIEKQN
ncbi:copper-binding protein [Noviherbaspirillum sp. DKR-6]|uniref:Copper-binding protein n=2 Tax=Noviherbaspirillum pedocola TaxID=2801341 RepID=A0A934W9X4_9BURK|nr:copper-binding protein [Noviherbaspirillum pedocola]